LWECICILYVFVCNNAENIIAVATVVIALATLVITWLNYIPIKGHKFSALQIVYMGKASGYYSGGLILFNHKNKTEVICKIYAKLKNGSLLFLDVDAGSSSSKNWCIDVHNPLTIEPYQNKEIYIRKASYFIAQKTQKPSNYYDIHNNIVSYCLVLSDGKCVEVKRLEPNKTIRNIEKRSYIIRREVCKGKILIKNKNSLNFNLYNHFGRIYVFFSDDNSFNLDEKKRYSEQSIKQEILKKANLPKNSKAQLGSDLDMFLKTLKQNNDEP